MGSAGAVSVAEVILSYSGNSHNAEAQCDNPALQILQQVFSKQDCEMTISVS